MLSPEARQRLHQLEFRSKKRVEELLQGGYASLFKGQGLEFAEVREYIPGDDVRYLDWNVSARFGKPFVKLNEEERELTLMFLVDASASMECGGGLGSKADLAAQLVALLSFAALRFGHKVGMLRFAERVERYVEPRKGQQHIMRILGEVMSSASLGRGTDIEAALRYFYRIHPRRAVVFLLSDLLIDDAPECFLSGHQAGAGESVLERFLRLSCRRHQLSVLRLVSPLERQMPSVGKVRWRDAESGRTLSVDTSSAAWRQRYAVHMANLSSAWGGLVRSSGGSYAEFSSAEDPLENLLAFMRRVKC